MNINTTIENLSLELDTFSYNNLTNKPKINNIELTNNKTLSDLGVQGTLTPGTGISIVNNIISLNLSNADTEEF